MIILADEKRVDHSEATPHFDGKQESIINDSLATQGAQMGVTLEQKESFAREKNPFDVPIKTDPGMAEFNRIMNGKKMNDSSRRND